MIWALCAAPLLSAATPVRAQFVRAVAAGTAAPIAAVGASRTDILSFDAALAPLSLPAAMISSLPPLETAPVPPTTPVPAYPIPVQDRSTFSRKISMEIARRRAAILEDGEDPRISRFPMPKTKAYVGAVAARLLSGSNLQGLSGPAGLLVRLNDSAWGKPAASMSAGILTLDPEMIAIMASEDEIAAVVAHEIVHYLRAHDEYLLAARPRDWNPFKGRGGGDIFDAPEAPSRKEVKLRWAHEYEADALSLRLLVNAGYDPEASISALLTILNENDTEPRYSFDRDRPDPMHPPVEARVQALRGVIAQEAMTATPRSARGLAEVYQELAGRRRGSRPEDVPASELYGHYKRPKTFVP